MKIAFTGDIVLQEVNKEPDFVFGSILNFLNSDQIKLCINLESPFITNNMSAVKKKITLYSYTDNVKHLKYLNPYLVNLSNNHINDYGNDSGKLTLKTLISNSISSYGAGYAQEKNYVFIDNKSKIIQLAFTTRSADMSGEKLFSTADFIGPYPPDLSIIKYFRDKYQNYSIIVNMHWGQEDIKYPEPEKRELAYQIIDAGADLIIGHHPHIIQPVERYKGKLIYYSLGNFYFNDINYIQNGIKKHKRAKKHQREGLMPVFNLKNGDIRSEIVLKIKVRRNGQLSYSHYKNSKFILKNNQLYSFLHKNYMNFIRISLLTKNVINNPKLVLKKYKSIILKIKSLENKSTFYTKVFFIPRTLLSLYKSKIMSDRAYIISQYRKVFGINPNLKNPDSFTEKMQWLKLYDKNPLYPICADKYKVRDFVKERIGEDFLIPLLYATDQPKNIPFEKLPAEYIIKTNHTSGYNMIYNNGKISFFGKDYKFDKTQIISTLSRWLNKNVFYQNREWEYKDIPPKILIEELLHDESNNDLLNDYKIHCFNGKPCYIQTIFDRNEGVKENWFDTDWKPVDLYYFSANKKQIEKPGNLSELLNVAEKLAKDFNYVRVDLYSINKKILFGELTFHPYSGLMKFQPQEWDKKLGDLLKLPIDE
nr:ATP-grasp fold amidoligase family protein [uncultured Draconibacterium sp.]